MKQGTKKLMVVLCPTCGKGRRDAVDTNGVRIANAEPVWAPITEGERLEIKLNWDSISFFKSTCPDCAAAQQPESAQSDKQPIMSLVMAGARKLFSSFSIAA